MQYERECKLVDHEGAIKTNNKFFLQVQMIFLSSFKIHVHQI